MAITKIDRRIEKLNCEIEKTREKAWARHMIGKTDYALTLYHDSQMLLFALSIILGEDK